MMRPHLGSKRLPGTLLQAGGNRLTMSVNFAIRNGTNEARAGFGSTSPRGDASRARFPSRLRFAAQQLEQVGRREDSDKFSPVHHRQRVDFSPAHDPGRLFDLGARPDDRDAAAHHLIDRPVEPEISDEQGRKVSVGHDADDLALPDDDEVTEPPGMHSLQGLLGGTILADRFNPLPHQFFDSQITPSFGIIRNGPRLNIDESANF
jgi:hypothetical protein